MNTTTGKIQTGVFLSFAAFFVLGLSCIPVEDLGIYWNKGVIDPDLEGAWKLMDVEHRSQDKYLSFEKAETMYHHIQIDANTPKMLRDDEQNDIIQARTLEFDGYSFLMYRQPIPRQLRQPGKNSNEDMNTPDMMYGLQRYDVRDGTLIYFTLDETILVQKIESGEITGRIPKKQENNDAMNFDLPTITKLDEKTLKTLTALAQKNKHWKIANKYERVKNLKEALKTSRTYPAQKDTRENATVNINQPDLDYLADDKHNILLRHLSASPEWKVHKDRNELVAYRREFTEGQWTISLNGYKSYFDSTVKREDHWQERYMFRFSLNPGGLFARNREETLAPPLAGALPLKLKSDQQGIESYLVVGKRRVWFEFFEQSHKEPRNRTRAALKWLSGFLNDIHKNEKEIREKGYAAKLMPENATRKGKPELRIEDGNQGGIFNVYAWVNPGSPSMIYLKAFNADTGERLSEERLTRRSAEYTGWSTDSDQQFFYNAHITIYEGDWDHKYKARFELWAKDEKTGNEKKLVELTREICGWER